MTEQDIPQRIAMPSTFASTATKTTIADVSGNTLNYKDGFPSSYATPSSQGGRYITREDINAVLNLPTNDLFYYKCGGVNVYDKAFSQKIGGYPKGAILKYISGNNIYDVISLIDNNTYDFTETPTYINNIYWTFLNKPEFSQRVPPSRDYLFTLSGEVYGGFANVIVNGNSNLYRQYIPLCVKKFPAGKNIICQGKVDIETLGAENALGFDTPASAQTEGRNMPAGITFDFHEYSATTFTPNNLTDTQCLWQSCAGNVRINPGGTNDQYIITTKSNHYYVFALYAFPLQTKAAGVERYGQNVKYTYTFNIYSLSLTT